MTGMPWSGYWGDGWREVSGKITPRPAIEQPNSAVVRTGDLDRFGNQIPWVLQETPVPASESPTVAATPKTDAETAPEGHSDDVSHQHTETVGVGGSTDRAASLNLDAIATIARAEGLIAGFSIALPSDTAATANNAAVFGSFTASDPWPGRIQHEKSMYIDQFSGRVLSVSTPGDWGQGALGTITEFGVQTHMGTQFGVISRAIMTFGCVAVL